METAQFKRIREFALKFVKPMTERMDLEKDSIQITTTFEDKTILFIVCGIEKDGIRAWELSFLNQPKDENFQMVTTFL
ncbi:hypothetical protein [Pedobacter sp. CFBP9032]|uniref:hypothetical protein n=1 Tax=Pedobacter sp. CFBP9032 TaxID=3096539 RepID=UPI002A6B10B0|nr:hypothetical protein [Pedobacter sp. CFBP9032]MDY0905608.1 hypothetical protein [Pedobacter sp. CFBP9032]